MIKVNPICSIQGCGTRRVKTEKGLLICPRCDRPTGSIARAGISYLREVSAFHVALSGLVAAMKRFAEVYQKEQAKKKGAEE